jgi:hypothetical protein
MPRLSTSPVDCSTVDLVGILVTVKGEGDTIDPVVLDHAHASSHTTGAMANLVVLALAPGAATDLIGLVRAHSVLTRAVADLVVLALTHTLLMARVASAAVLVGLAHAHLIGAVTHALLIINKADLSDLAHILLVVGAKGAGAATVPIVVTHHTLLLWAVDSNLLNLLQFQMESWTPSHLLALRL